MVNFLIVIVFLIPSLSMASNKNYKKVCETGLSSIGKPDFIVTYLNEPETNKYGLFIQKQDTEYLYALVSGTTDKYKSSFFDFVSLFPSTIAPVQIYASIVEYLHDISRIGTIEYDELSELYRDPALRKVLRPGKRSVAVR